MRRKNIPEDFWKKVNKQIENGCWEWTGATSGLRRKGIFYKNEGYGNWRINDKNVLTHRYSLELAGIDLQDFDVLHKCDNPKCVNPDHLFLGTHQENMRDMKQKGRWVPKQPRKIDV